MEPQRQTLEDLALAGHRRGVTWPDFWAQYGPAVIAAEPYDRQRFHRLRDRLLALVVSGDDSGMEPVDADPAPWERDDQTGKPDDSQTQAKCLLALRPLPTREEKR